MISGSFAQICQVALVHTVVSVRRRGFRDLVKLICLTLGVDEIKLVVDEFERTDSEVQLDGIAYFHSVLQSHHHLLQDVNDCLLWRVSHFRDLVKGNSLEHLRLEESLDCRR